VLGKPGAEKEKTKEKKLGRPPLFAGGEFSKKCLKIKKKKIYKLI